MGSHYFGSSSAVGTAFLGNKEFLTKCENSTQKRGR